jgi:hypothetical protein
VVELWYAQDVYMHWKSTMYLYGTVLQNLAEINSLDVSSFLLKNAIALTFDIPL